MVGGDTPDRRLGPLAAFLALSYGGSVAISLAIGLTGGHRSPIVGLGFLAMLVPALAVLAVRLAAKARIPDAGFGRFPLRWLPVALLVFPAVGHLASLPSLVLLEGRVPWAAWLTPAADGLVHVREDLGWGALSPSMLAARIALSAVLTLLVVSVLAFFEEIGWRAWMLPRLADRLGERRAAWSSARLARPLRAERDPPPRERRRARPAPAAPRTARRGARARVALVSHAQHLDGRPRARLAQQLG